ncbi:unnamed protein product, partial [Mesorhabditis spiculigera]
MYLRRARRLASGLSSIPSGDRARIVHTVRTSEELSNQSIHYQPSTIPEINNETSFTVVTGICLAVNFGQFIYLKQDFPTADDYGEQAVTALATFLFPMGITYLLMVPIFRHKLRNDRGLLFRLYRRLTGPTMRDVAVVPPKVELTTALAHISESSSKNALGNHQLKQRLQRAVRENPETMAYIKAIYHFDYEIYCNLKKEAHEYFLIRHTTDKQALAKQFLQLFETANIPKHYAEKSFTSKRLCELAAMLRFLLCTFLFFGGTYGSLATFKRLHKHAFNPFEDTLETADDPAIIYSNITQPVDHFDDKLTDTWQQQYQYNPKFYTKDRPLVFLMLGGEGPIGGGGDKWIKNENVSMMRWAKEFGAAAMQVEHRFYGNSRPYPQQTTANLKFLTVKQVLADIKEFITQMNKMYFNDVTPRWITFGGSYPGSLSAWFRETYPEMTIGAVSTSSAVNTRVDYYGYAVNTEKNYRKNSDACGDAIGAAFNQIINALYTDDAARKSLQQDLPTSINFTIGDKVPIARQVQYFFSNLYGIYQGINQYSGDNRNANSDAGEGIPKACDFMTDKNGNAYRNLLNLVKWDNGLNGAPNVDNDYASFVANMQKTDYSDEGWASYRTWVWQTCTFLGYFQTTDGGNSGIFGSIIPLDFYVDQCIDIFGKDYIADTVYAGVEQNQKDYGGDKNYRGTKVVFPNGSIDPWWSLGKLTPNNASEVDAFTMEGTAHCADMYPWRDNELQSLKDGPASIAPTTSSANYISPILLAVISIVVAKYTKTSEETAKTFASLFFDEFFRARFDETKNEDEAYNLLLDQYHLENSKSNDFIEKHAKQPWYPGRGVWEDLKLKLHFYGSDYSDGFADRKTPLSIYILVIFNIATTNHWDFWHLYACVGIWCQIFLFLYAVFEASVIMKHSKRSTEELFSLFISTTFVYKAVSAMVRVYNDHACLVNAGHAHWIEFWRLPPAGHLVAFGLGFPLSILFFMDQLLVTNTVDNKQNNLKKGSSHNWDFVVVAALNTVLSVFGLPWMHGGLPQSFLHLKALADVRKDGTGREIMHKVRETRVAVLAAHLLMVPFYYLLPHVSKLMPISLFYGLFLFMAISSLTGHEFFERIQLFFTQQSLYPKREYITKVDQRTINKFTLCQLVQLAILLAVGMTPIAYVRMTFPLVIFMFIPIRNLVLPKIFSRRDLELVDGVH